MIPKFYKPITEIYGLTEDMFLQCPKCKTLPKINIYDNGEFAKCDCNDMWDRPSAEGINIWQYSKKYNGVNNWNTVAKSRVK